MKNNKIDHAANSLISDVTSTWEKLRREFIEK